MCRHMGWESRVGALVGVLLLDLRGQWLSLYPPAGLPGFSLSSKANSLLGSFSNFIADYRNTCTRLYKPGTPM